MVIRNSKLLDKLLGKPKKEEKESLLLSVLRLLGFNKETVKTFIKSFLVVLSLASAHYSGFMSGIPFEMLSIVAVDFLSSFIALFVFYFLMCYTVARVIAFAASQFYYSFFHTLAALFLWLKKRWPHRLKRAGPKLYKEAALYEVLFYWVVGVIVFYFIFDFSYLKVNFSSVSNMVWILCLFVFAALVMKAGFFARAPKRVMKRLVDRKRIAHRRQLLKAFIYFLTGVSLGFSYYLGMVRFNKVMGENPVYIESENFNGMANVLMKSGESFLLIDKSVGAGVFYYISERFSVRLERGEKNTEQTESVTPMW